MLFFTEKRSKIGLINGSHDCPSAVLIARVLILLRMVRLLKVSNDFYAEKASVRVEHSFTTMLSQGNRGKLKNRLWTCPLMGAGFEIHLAFCMTVPVLSSKN